MASQKISCSVTLFFPSDLIEFHPMKRLKDLGWKIRTHDVDENRSRTTAKAKFKSMDDLELSKRQAVRFLERYFVSALTREFHIDASKCVERCGGMVPVELVVEVDGEEASRANYVVR